MKTSSPAHYGHHGWLTGSDHGGLALAHSGGLAEPHSGGLAGPHSGGLAGQHSGELAEPQSVSFTVTTSHGDRQPGKQVGKIYQVDGAGDVELDSENNLTFRCEPCEKQFPSSKTLKQHMSHYCRYQLGLDPIKLMPRRNLSVSETHSIEDAHINSLQNVTIYKIDKEFELYLNSCSDNFAKFKLCENLCHPIAVPNFWPILLDYRGTDILHPVHENICYTNGYEVMNSILMDGYNLYGISSIQIKKKAGILKDDKMFPISNYRVPTSHLQEHKNPRPDKPFFNIEHKGDLIEISLHPEFLKTLPPRIDLLESIAESEDLSSEDDDLDASRISDLFSQFSLHGSEEDPLSQPVSNVRLLRNELTPPAHAENPPSSKPKRPVVLDSETQLKVKSLPKLKSF